MSGPYGFPSWNYGYTLCPQTGAQFYQPPPSGQWSPSPRGRGRGGGRGFSISARGQVVERPKLPKPEEAAAPVAVPKVPEVKAEPATVAAAAVAPTATATPAAVDDAKEEGEIVERPMEEILKGRNPIVFCNDQSKTVSRLMPVEKLSQRGSLRLNHCF